jgi:hypothetical protein
MRAAYSLAIRRMLADGPIFPCSGAPVSRGVFSRARFGPGLFRPALLGHERWLAELVRQRQAVHRTPGVLRTEDRLGPDGIVLLAAALTNVLLGQGVILLGLGLAAFAPAWPAVHRVGLTLMAVGAVVAAVSVVRIAQGLAAGRAHRASRTV